MYKIRFIKQKLSCILAILILLSSCDKGLEEMNKNPNAYEVPVIESVFSSAILRHCGQSGNPNNTTDPNSKQAGSWMQYNASLAPVEWYGEKYLWRQGYYDRFWNYCYQIDLKELTDVINLTKDDPSMSNLYNTARILRVEVLHRITDMYGDVPYSEAGKGATDKIYKPKYDKQSDIYADMLKELEEAANALDPSKRTWGPGDFIYYGNLNKWKTMAYSLMLRLGMRLTKVNAGMAETWVKKAIAGGVMKSNDDIPLVKHYATNGTTWNCQSDLLQKAEGVPPSAQGKGLFKLNKTFIDHLLGTKDPRLPFYSTLWQGNADLSKLSIYSDPAIQKGMPGGQDAATMKDIIPDWNDDMRPGFSEINLWTICHLEAPSVFQSYSEVEYLLAEAALRKWGAPLSAKEHYERGVRASMLAQTLFPNSPTAEEAIDMSNKYLIANPYIEGGFDVEMEQIHTQMWASLYMFLNNMEVWANWRRTGYPKLTPHNYPGNMTGGTIPRRVTYSTTEHALNAENYAAANAIQGPDLFTTRIWWDKE